MNSEIVLRYVERIENHREIEVSMWDEFRALPDYEPNQDKDLASIIDCRKSSKDAMADAEMYLFAFDCVPDF